MSRNLLVISEAVSRNGFPLDSFLASLACDGEIVRVASGDPDALARVKDILTNTPLVAVLFADADSTEHLFSEVRHVAGADQSLVCLLPEIASLRAASTAATRLTRRNKWRQILSRADGVWTAQPADAAWLAAEFGLHQVETLPRFKSRSDGLSPWLKKKLAAAKGTAQKRNSYGGPADLTSLILLTHNDGGYLKKCLESVRRHTAGPHEIIVVDNGTTDGSVNFLRRETDLRLCRSERNVFFAAGCNIGLRHARGRYAVLLNADVVVTPSWLETMVRRVKRDPTVGLAGPYTNHAAGAQRVARPGYTSLKDLDAFARRWAREHEGGRLYPPRLDGFCLLIRREVLDRVGLLDERFGPGGYEDYDYCLRVRQAGYRLMLAEEAYVHHHGGRGYAGKDYENLRRRNRELLVEKWCQRSLEFLDEVW